MSDYVPEPPPSRHSGSRVITREPNLVRVISTIRDNVAAQASRVRREDILFTESDPDLGVPATFAVLTNTHVTKVSRSGHTLFVDAAAGTGAASVVEARISVPDLSLTGAPVTSPAGGVDRDMRLTMAMPDAWEMGAAYRVYVQARRVSGIDPTTMRILRAWQR